MQNFVLYNPTKIIFGTDTVKEIGPETAALGRKILLVYGQGSIRRNGVYEQVLASLAAAGLDISEHGGVVSNPLLSHVRAGIELAKKKQVEAVVAVGGGSVIDSAKAIAAGALVEHDVWQFFKAKKSIRKTLPLTCVLTLAAAGSEMNGGMVLTNDETRHKFGVGNRLLCPRVSILDPTLTFTVPPDYTAYGAVDAIAHILEFYFTTRDPATPVQDRFMEGLVINIMASCEQVLANPSDYQSRADLMWAATLALNGWTAAGLGMVGFPMHMIEHSLSALYNIAHGAGLSIVMPAWMRRQARLRPGKFSQFGQRVFNLAGSEESCAMAGIKCLEEWFARVNSPTSLSQVGISAADIPVIAENALALARIWRLNEYGKEVIMDILAACA
ncbi:MAG: iron-containing alcohol dehydrogenase [Thermodesulfobacteriota bacterium]